MQFRILFQDDRLVAIDKPAGFHVHPPEDTRHRIPRSTNCLHLLRKQIDRYLYPVHRLDGATSGVLVFALDTEAAADIQRQFRDKTIHKSYFAVTRGWPEPSGVIDSPLNEAESRTCFEMLSQTELNEPLGKYPTSRYSLVRVTPETGRMHQIRRHFAHLRHPIIGDTIYGDGKHNRFFRQKIEGSGLFLKAYSLSLKHPSDTRTLTLHARWNHVWHQAFDLFGVCPFPTPTDNRCKDERPEFF